MWRDWPSRNECNDGSKENVEVVSVFRHDQISERICVNISWESQFHTLPSSLSHAWLPSSVGDGVRVYEHACLFSVLRQVF